jgi:hypothetical protein
MKIQAGKYYRRRDGEVIGPATTRTDKGSSYQWTVGGLFFTDDGRYQARGPDCDYDLIAEVTVTDVLPFELKAGERYETVKPDGTPGPVVTLHSPRWNTKLIGRYMPFANYIPATSYITVNGDIFDMDGKPLGRITAPYVEPKPPTMAERLEQAIELLANPRQDDSAFALIRGCVAELKHTESRPKDSPAG